MAAAAAVIQRKEREIVDTFRGAAAVSPDRARDPSELGVDKHLAFSRLVHRAVLREGASGKYYLDEPSWNALRSLRRRLVIVILLLAVAAFVVLAASGVFTSGTGRPA